MSGIPPSPALDEQEQQEPQEQQRRQRERRRQRRQQRRREQQHRQSIRDQPAAASWVDLLGSKSRLSRETIRTDRLGRLMRRVLVDREEDGGASSRNVDGTSEGWKKFIPTLTVRRALHDETRFEDVRQLRRAMRAWWDGVPDMIEFNARYGHLPLTTLPAGGARMVIAPHGDHFLWSGETAAFAYKALDLSQAKTVIILCDALFTDNIIGLALPDPIVEAYATPLTMQPLALDITRLNQLRITGRFETISPQDEEREYTLEMQLCWLHYILREVWHEKLDQYPLILPMYVGKHFLPETSGKSDLKELFANPEVCVIVSADLTRWGPGSDNFFYARRARTCARYLPIQSKYLPQPDRHAKETAAAIDRNMMSAKISEKDIFTETSPIRDLAVRRRYVLKHDPPIFETIAFTDQLCLRCLTLRPQNIYSSFLKTKQLLSTKSMGVSGALCVALSVLESMFEDDKTGGGGGGRGAGDDDEENESSISCAEAGMPGPCIYHEWTRRNIHGKGRMFAAPFIGGVNLNHIPLESLHPTMKLKLVALLQRKKKLTRGRFMLLRYDRDRHTDSTAVPSTSFCAAYAVLD